MDICGHLWTSVDTDEKIVDYAVHKCPWLSTKILGIRDGGQKKKKGKKKREQNPEGLCSRQTLNPNLLLNEGLFR